MPSSNGCRRNPPLSRAAWILRGSGALAALAFAAGSVAAPGVTAAELGDENTRISLDTTLTQGFSFRVSKRNDSITGVNTDDGDRNYNTGLISNTSKFTMELDIDGGPVGMFARVHGFADWENRDGDRDRTQLSKTAKEEIGDGLDILDLYVSSDFEVGDTPAGLRLGNQVLNWGESTFIQDGISVINPLDASKLRKPGAELRDGLVPVPMVSGYVDFAPDLSLEAFLQTEWKKTRVDPAGTYFSTNDYGSPGGTHAYVQLPGVDIRDNGQGVSTFSPQLIGGLSQAFAAVGLPAIDQSTVLSVNRQADRTPDDSGQWGLAVRHYSEQLNDTEFGFYFVNYHSRLPVASIRYGTSEGVANGVNAFNTTMGLLTRAPFSLPPAQAGGVATIAGIDQYGKTAGYFIEYPEDLRVFGVSFNTLLGATGWALQGEYSFHPDQPLQIHETNLFATALAPIVCSLPTATPPCPPSGPFLDGFVNSVAGTTLQGYVERDVSQLQMTATQVFGPTIGADSLTFLVEGALVHVHDLPDPATLPLDTPGTGDAATANSYGYRAAAKLDYANAIGAATLSPYLQFQHDVYGYSPSPTGAFEKGRTAVTLGLGVNYLDRWRSDLSYTNYGGETNALRARDFVSFSTSYSF